MSMTYQEFNMCRRQWASEWKEKWSALDIDFKTFMLMKGITEKQYEELYNTKPDIPSPSHDDYNYWPHESF
jgi:hypothetical protein